jgi:hypothetical protein
MTQGQTMTPYDPAYQADMAIGGYLGYSDSCWKTIGIGGDVRTHRNP